MNHHFTLPAMLVLVNLCFSAQDAHCQTANRFLQSRFDSFDKNGDRKISISESPRPLVFRRFDKDGDGSLTIDEFRGLIEMAVGQRSSTNDDNGPWTPGVFTASIPDDAPISKESVLAAAEYSAANKGVSFLVMYDGQTVYADYPGGGAADRDHELASGTKSFTGVMAIAAIEDGIIDSLDERVGDTITEWKSDPQKSKITVRHLLNLTSGLEPEGDGRSKVPSYKVAIARPSIHAAGEKFDYGPTHFQCFGEFLRRKLKASGSSDSPLDYLQRRIFDPIGLKYGRWRRDEDGNAHLPSGASLTAIEWAKFGEFIRLGGRWDDVQIIPKDKLDQCFVGEDTNPAYGLTFWLNREVDPIKRRSILQLRFATDDVTDLKKVPADLVFAAGAGKQRLFISRDAKLVVVRQANGIIDALGGVAGGYSDRDFLDRLMK